MSLSASNPQALEEALQNNLYLTGDLPTYTDAQVFSQFQENVPDKAAHPHLYSWYCFINQFSDKIRNTWAAPADAEAEDDFDLFAEDPNLEEESKKIAEEKAKSKKQAPVGRSSVVFEVKPNYSTVNLDELAQRIHNEIQLPGLKWGDDYKKQPVAFGLYKLLMGCVIEDTVETDMIVEKIMEFRGEVEIEEEDDEGEATGNVTKEEDDLVQSVDIGAFQKL